MSCINEYGSSDDDDIFRIRLSSGGTRTLYIQLPSPPRTSSLTFCRGNLLNATYDVSLIHRGPPMRLAAVIRYYGRPIAIGYGGHPAPGRKHAPRQGKRRGKMLLQPDSRWAPGRVSSGRALYGWVIWRCESSCWVRAGGTRSTLRLSYPSSRGPGDLPVSRRRKTSGSGPNLAGPAKRRLGLA